MTKGRFAPTPSGDLHLGNVRTAIVAWLHARATGGSIQLRIDDLDVERCREEIEYRQLEDLAWIGLTWDGETIRQSERGDRYRAALAQLEAAGLTYPCFCSRAEIRAAASAPHGDAGPEEIVGMLAGMFGIGDGSPSDLDALVPLAAGLAG